MKTWFPETSILILCGILTTFRNKVRKKKYRASIDDAEGFHITNMLKSKRYYSIQASHWRQALKIHAEARHFM